MTDDPNVQTGLDEQPLPPHVEQAYRRLSRRAIIVTSVLVIVVLVAAGVIGSSAISRRFKGARQLDRAMLLLEQSDAVVLDVDEVVRAEASPDIATQATALRPKIPVARADLVEARRLIADSMDSVTEDEQKRAQLVRAAVVARIGMLEPADVILDANAKAGLALKPAQDGWTLVLGAEKLADESVRQYNKLTKDRVTRSSRLAEQASRQFRQARPYFSQAETAFPEADFKRYLDFVDGKVALLALSRRSNTAWLAGNILAANAAIRRYNAQEQRIVELARGLPQTPGKAIADAYEDLAASATERYYRAREAATKADARLDEF